MTRVHQNHLSEAKSVLAVQQLLAKAGALSEVVKNDYGEDLLVQTQLKGSADHFQVMIQVKSRSIKTKENGYFSVRFSTAHLYRWGSQLNETIVFIYDTDSDLIYHFFPSKKFSLWDLAITEKKSLSVRLGEDDVVHAEIVKKIIWECRLTYYSRFLAINQSKSNHLYGTGDHSDRLKSIQLEESLISFRLLTALDVIDDDKINRNFLNRFSNAINNFSKKSDPPSVGAAMMLCVLASLDDVAGKIGMPGIALEATCNLMGTLMQMMEPAIWSRATSLLPLFEGDTDSNVN